MDNGTQANETQGNEKSASEVKGPVLYKFTNQAESGELDNLLAMFYQGVMHNDVGIMTAWNIEKGEEELILVGVSLDEDGKADCFPIAKCLTAQDVNNYLAPNGKGDYYDPRNPSEVAEAKEGMRSYNEAIIE